LSTFPKAREIEYNYWNGLCVTISECIDKGWISEGTAKSMLADVALRCAAKECGFVAYLKNSFGPSLSGHELPPQWSIRWRDSYIVYLDWNKAPEEIVVAAITHAQPI